MPAVKDIEFDAAVISLTTANFIAILVLDGLHNQARKCLFNTVFWLSTITGAKEVPGKGPWTNYSQIDQVQGMRPRNLQR